jgi:hypothetical protein
MIYFSLGIKDLNLPLMSLVDYRGFRLVSLCLLPVNSKTLIYGTADGGKTIMKKDTYFSKMMEETSKRLNLCPHICGGIKKKTKELHSAADIEGHLGLDHKYYLLDFSRTMPPVRPDPRFTNGHLYRLFRREFVEKNPTPLCSDAYSGFVVWDPNHLKYNQDVNVATNFLLHTVAPECGIALLRVHTFF